ncbi:MAG: phospholipase D-like domain-containing protein [Myxococcota bacterium]|nr:phospholipase D-like domain-containing protein [Myxococcota bacterium]
MSKLTWIIGGGALAAYWWTRDERRDSATSNVTPYLGTFPGRWVWPVASWNGRAPTISDGFNSPRPGLPRHGGVDIMFKRHPSDTFAAKTPNASKLYVMPDGHAVVAASDGVVWSAMKTPHGNAVVIDHGPRKVSTFYTHLDKLLVTPTAKAASKQQVRVGQVIGTVGFSPLDGQKLKHLHFEVWLGAPSLGEPAVEQDREDRLMMTATATARTASRREHGRATLRAVKDLLARVRAKFRPARSHTTFKFHRESFANSKAFATALYQSVGSWMESGHRIELVDNGLVFDRVEAEIRKARSSVNVLMYIWEDGRASDRIVAALNERAGAGVHCRILVDALGSAEFDADIGARLRAGGCEVRIFRPSIAVTGLARNHRKVLVMDGAVAVTGGFGIRDCWLGGGRNAGEWRDASAVFSGPAVHGAQQAFAENWQEAGGELLPASDFPDPSPTGTVRAAFVTSTASPNVTRAERLTQLMIASAQKRLWIVNAYFVPSAAIVDMLAAKAAAGVDVRLLVAGRTSDSKLAFGAQQLIYRQLIEQGVRVWEYQPCMLHSKTMVIDESLTLVGSVNLDPLSLNELEEVALVVDDRTAARELEASFLKDCEHATLQSL